MRTFTVFAQYLNTYQDQRLEETVIAYALNDLCPHWTISVKQGGYDICSVNWGVGRDDLLNVLCYGK